MPLVFASLLLLLLLLPFLALLLGAAVPVPLGSLAALGLFGFLGLLLLGLFPVPELLLAFSVEFLTIASHLLCVSDISS